MRGAIRRALASTFFQPFRDELSHLSLRREHAEESQRSGVDYLFAVYEYGELAVSPFNELDIHLQLASQVSRHPGGLDTGDSITTATDRDRQISSDCACW